MKHLLPAAKWLGADFASTIFFVVLYALTRNAMLSTACAMGLGIAQIVWLKARGRPVDAMQWSLLGLVLAFGTASLITHDSRFIMFKPTLVMLAVAAVMLKRGWMNRYLPPVVTENAPETGVIFGYVWAGMMALSAVLNAVVALTCDARTWGTFVAVYPLASKLALVAIQYPIMRAMVTRRIKAQRGEVPQALAAPAQP